jgi:tetratricopeptide (TPR) repeat protein
LTAIPEDVRQSALSYADGLKASPSSWLVESSETVSWAGSSRPVYERAHRQARAAIKSGQQDPWAFGVLALAEYRLGNFERAEQARLRVREVAQEGAFAMTSPVDALILHRLGRKSDARRALAEAWGSVNSLLMMVFGDEAVGHNRRLLDEAKQELLGADALELESIWAPRVVRELGLSGTDRVEKILQSVPTHSDTVRELVPYLIAEQLVRQVAERELVTSRIAEQFETDSELPESVREIAIPMANQMATDPNRLYARSMSLWTPGLTDQTYRIAAEQVDELMAIVLIFPKGSQAMGRFVEHQGIAQYRTGRLEECVESITRAKAMPMGQTAFSEACLAMANHRLGKTEEARSFLSEIPVLRKDLESLPNHLLLPLLREVESVLGVADESSTHQN